MSHLVYPLSVSLNSSVIVQALGLRHVPGQNATFIYRSDAIFGGKRFTMYSVNKFVHSSGPLGHIAIQIFLGGFRQSQHPTQHVRNLHGGGVVTVVSTGFPHPSWPLRQACAPTVYSIAALRPVMSHSSFADDAATVQLSWDSGLPAYAL